MPTRPLLHRILAARRLGDPGPGLVVADSPALELLVRAGKVRTERRDDGALVAFSCVGARSGIDRIAIWRLTHPPPRATLAVVATLAGGTILPRDARPAAFPLPRGGGDTGDRMIAEAIRLWLSRGHTRAELARLCGVSAGTVTYWLSGTPPIGENRERLAGVLGVDLPLHVRRGRLADRVAAEEGAPEDVAARLGVTPRQVRDARDWLARRIAA